MSTTGLMLIEALTKRVGALRDAIREHMQAEHISRADVQQMIPPPLAAEEVAKLVVVPSARDVAALVPRVVGEVGPQGATGPQGPEGPEGPQGPVGPMPRHEWDKSRTKLRFEIAPQQWGSWSENLRGPAGNAGGTVFFDSQTGGGDRTTYTHEQTAPAEVWTVPHNLSRKPAVTVVDMLGEQLLSDVRFVDDDIVQITHSAPTIGRVYCN